MRFTTRQLDRVRPLWDRMLSHPFLLRTRDGEIPRDVFATWMQQDYHFVEAAIPFMAALLPKAPDEHWEPLIGVMGALQKELRLFEDRAAAVGVDLRAAPPSFTCHAYVQFLLATAYRSSYAEGFTVLYAAEKAYHDSWKVVREGLDERSPWFPFVDNWAGDAFAEYVAWLETELDGLAAAAGDAERARMAELFELTTKYEIAFWEMAVTDAAWPGVDGGGQAAGADAGGASTGAGGAGGAEAGSPEGGAVAREHAWEGVVRKREEG